MSALVHVFDKYDYGRLLRVACIGQSLLRYKRLNLEFAKQQVQYVPRSYHYADTKVGR